MSGNKLAQTKWKGRNAVSFYAQPPCRICIQSTKSQPWPIIMADAPKPGIWVIVIAWFSYSPTHGTSSFPRPLPDSWRKHCNNCISPHNAQYNVIHCYYCCFHLACFQINLGQPVPLVLSASTDFKREPLAISGTELLQVIILQQVICPSCHRVISVKALKGTRKL